MLNLQISFLILLNSAAYVWLVVCPRCALCSSLYQRDLPLEFYIKSKLNPLYPTSISSAGDEKNEDVAFQSLPPRQPTSTFVLQSSDEINGDVDAIRQKKIGASTLKPASIPSQENEDFKHQVNIERFKMSFLKRLHMTEPPNIQPNEVDEMIRSLPITLQQKLMRNMEASNGVTDPPLDQTEEKETLILLKLRELSYLHDSSRHAIRIISLQLVRVFFLYFS